MSPLMKNAALAWLAGFVVSLTGFVLGTDTTDVPALKAAGLAAIWAGCRALAGWAREQIAGKPFAVDTEAPQA